MHSAGLRKQVDVAPTLLWSAAWLALVHLLDTRAADGSVLEAGVVVDRPALAARVGRGAFADMGAHGWRSFRASDSRLGRELDSAWRAIQAELGDGQGDTEVRILRLPLGSVAPATSAHRPPA